MATQIEREKTVGAIDLVDLLVQESYVLYGIGIACAVMVGIWAHVKAKLTHRS